MWVLPGASDDIAILEVGSKDVAIKGRLTVQRRDVEDGEPLAQDDQGGKVWPVVLGEIDQQARVDKSRDEVQEAGEILYRETGRPVTIKEIVKIVRVGERTVRERVRDLVHKKAWQQHPLPGGGKKYTPWLKDSGG